MTVSTLPLLKHARCILDADGLALNFTNYSVVSLPSDFLVWVSSSEAAFLRSKLAFSCWDVDELKSREKQIVGGKPGTGELWVGLSGFPRYINGRLL